MSSMSMMNVLNEHNVRNVSNESAVCWNECSQCVVNELALMGSMCPMWQSAIRVTECGLAMHPQVVAINVPSFRHSDPSS